MTSGGIIRHWPNPHSRRFGDRVLQLTHGCGRNLAQVRSIPMVETLNNLEVVPNPNVDQKTYVPRKAAANNQDERTIGRDFDYRDRTYTWSCKCGKTITRQHRHISEMWLDLETTTPDKKGKWRIVLNE